MTVHSTQTFTEELKDGLDAKTKPYYAMSPSIMKKSTERREAKALDCSRKIRTIRPAGTHTAAETVKT
jgi:hypothetical protein